MNYGDKHVNVAENPLYSDSNSLGGGSIGRSSLGGGSHFKNPLYDYAKEADEIAANSYYNEEQSQPGMLTAMFVPCIHHIHDTCKFFDLSTFSPIEFTKIFDQENQELSKEEEVYGVEDSP